MAEAEKRLSTGKALFYYSEWLDSQRLLKVPTDLDPKDERTHEDLVREFLAQWTGMPLPEDMSLYDEDQIAEDPVRHDERGELGPDPDVYLREAQEHQQASDDFQRPATAIRKIDGLSKMEHMMQVENKSLLAIAGYLQLIWQGRFND